MKRKLHLSVGITGADPEIWRGGGNLAEGPKSQNPPMPSIPQMKLIIGLWQKKKKKHFSTSPWFKINRSTVHRAEKIRRSITVACLPCTQTELSCIIYRTRTK